MSYDTTDAPPKTIEVTTEGEDLNGDPPAEYYGRAAADEVRELMNGYDTLVAAWKRHGSDPKTQPRLVAMPLITDGGSAARALWEHVKEHWQEEDGE